MRRANQGRAVGEGQMAIFLVVPNSNQAGIKKSMAALKEAKRLDFIDLPNEGAFVSFHGTAQELSNELGITDGSSGTGVVVAVSSYYGRAPTNIWEWVNSRWES